MRPCTLKCRNKRGPEGICSAICPVPEKPLPCPGQGRHLLGAWGSAPQCALCSAAKWVWGLGGRHELNAPRLGLWGSSRPEWLRTSQDRPTEFILDPHGSGGAGMAPEPSLRSLVWFTVDTYYESGEKALDSGQGPSLRTLPASARGALTPQRPGVPVPPPPGLCFSRPLAQAFFSHPFPRPAFHTGPALPQC